MKKNWKGWEVFESENKDYKTGNKYFSKEIFGQASKNIDGYRASIASKDIEIERLKSELEECRISEQSYKSTCEAQQCKRDNHVKGQG